MTEKSGLLSRLYKAQENAGAVAKKGENTQQNYRYARAEDVITEAQKALHGAGLVGTMAFSGADSREVQSAKGTGGLYIALTGALRISDPETGEVLEVPGFGSGIDYPGDKAVYKAMTGAAKYAYASALGIPFTDDPEDERGDQSRVAGGSMAGGGEATGPQKSAITRRCNELAISDEEKVILFKWAGAEKELTKRSASKLIGLLKDSKDWGDVWDRAEIPRPDVADDLPVAAEPEPPFPTDEEKLL